MAAHGQGFAYLRGCDARVDDPCRVGGRCGPRHGLRGRLRSALAPVQRTDTAAPPSPRDDHRIHPPLDDRGVYSAHHGAGDVDLPCAPGRNTCASRRCVVRTAAFHRGHSGSCTGSGRFRGAERVKPACARARYSLYQHTAPARCNFINMVVAATSVKPLWSWWSGSADSSGRARRHDPYRSYRVCCRVVGYAFSIP